jgi:DNA replication and repair protein RecF
LCEDNKIKLKKAFVELKKISLYQYKNHEQTDFEFPKRITCIYGQNGTGKTNLLDAIYTLVYCKSYFSSKDAFLVTNGKLGMRLAGRFEASNLPSALQIQFLIRENGKKELTHNDEAIKQISKHIGKVACIMIAPDDIQLINEGAEYRRKYLDASISQVNNEYLNNLVHYNKVMVQRNALLKRWDYASAVERELIEFYNEQMSTSAQFIFQERKKACTFLLEKAGAQYKEISAHHKNIQLSYFSKLYTIPLKDLFKASLQKDIILGRTTEGIHKDDVLIEFEHDQGFKEIASQGEKKTMLFALKLAQYDWLKQHLNTIPILLLDDIFEKLDAQRIQMLLNLVRRDDAQAFITDTHFERLQTAFPDEEVGFIKIG